MKHLVFLFIGIALNWTGSAQDNTEKYKELSINVIDIFRQIPVIRSDQHDFNSFALRLNTKSPTKNSAFRISALGRIQAGPNGTLEVRAGVGREFYREMGSGWQNYIGYEGAIGLQIDTQNDAIYGAFSASFLIGLRYNITDRIVLSTELDVTASIVAGGTEDIFGPTGDFNGIAVSMGKPIGLYLGYKFGYEEQ